MTSKVITVVAFQQFCGTNSFRYMPLLPPCCISNIFSLLCTEQTLKITRVRTASAVSTLPLFNFFLLSTDEDSSVMNQSIPDDVKRRERQFLNDVESIPMHMAIFILAFVIQTLCNATKAGRNGTIGLCVLYTVYGASRYLFTICYVLRLQVWHRIIRMDDFAWFLICISLNSLFGPFFGFWGALVC